ncbi:TolC family outer membrane protein [Marinobacterium sp. D7]|uniref:TolC family outer membrane protein n=1 Tax=Marinobacterium ramblicola TaxID=2849041 RepID=UPI001C2D952F|nr:TolC family outer membrane protein [Marinobacterium ramblicola]MBV1786441.1 TolC family outer membrane protein [Marinobacterium ramblicola]
MATGFPGRKNFKPLALVVSGVFVLGLAGGRELLAAEVVPATGTVQNNAQNEMATDEHRLLITAQPGELRATHLQANGQRLFVTLSASADLEQWRNKADQLLARPSIFHKAYVQIIGERNHLVVEFIRPVDLIDETVALNGDNRLSWELLLRERPVDASIRLLDEVKVEKRGNLFDLSFAGHSEMVVEVSLAEQGQKLVVELPGVPTGEVKLPEMPEFLGVPEVTPLSRGGSMLTFTPSRPVDLLDAQIGSVPENEASYIHLMLVPDSPVDVVFTPPKAIAMANLRSGFGLDLKADEAVQAQGYYLTSPGRLVVDFPGVPADAIEGVVGDFAADPHFIQRVRYGATGLGSARVEFTLDPSYAEGLARSVTPFLDRYAGALTVAMPQAAIQPQQGFPDDLKGIAGFDRDTLRHQPAFDFTRQPVLSIGSVTLDEAHYATETPIPKGERFKLLDLVDQSLEQDPTYLAARAEFRARSEVLPQAQADYLPQVSFSYQYSSKYQTVNESGSIPAGNYDVPGYNLSLNLTQPVYRRANLIAIDQAEVAVEQAKLALLAAEQDLILRLTSAYLDVLAAGDERDLAQAEHNAVTAQLEQAQIRFNSGLLSRADYNESRSLEALTRARAMKAEFKYQDARLAVKEIVGLEVESLHGFNADFRAAPPFPERVDRWVGAALDQNLALQAQRLSTTIAQKEVSRRSAEHLPTVDLFVSAGQQVSESTLFSDSRQDVSDYEMGLRLNVPIYSGGRSSSLVREATARLDKTQQEMEREYRKTERIVRSAYSSLVSSTAMLSALREGVLAQEIRLATRLKGFGSGVETSVSVLDAYQSYYAARRDFMQSRYEYLKNRLTLKQAVGSLARNDVADIDMMLEPVLEAK